MNADHVEEEATPAMRITTSHHDHPEAPDASPQPSADQDRLPGIRHLIAVGSGKGGLGRPVGLVDADVLGPLVEMVTCTARQFFKAAGLLNPMPEPQAHGGYQDPTN